jgi:hypothetical protein
MPQLRRRLNGARIRCPRGQYRALLLPREIEIVQHVARMAEDSGGVEKLIEFEF